MRASLKDGAAFRMWYDILAVAILAFTTIRGAMKGVIWQIAAIAGLVACFVFSESISAAAGPYVKLEPPLNNWVVMVGAYLLFSFASFSIAKLLTEWLDKIHFGDFNRHLGAIFGFVKGALIVLVLTFFSVTVSKDMHAVLQHSRTGHIAAQVMFHLHPVMPEKLHDTLARYINIHTLDDPELKQKYEERHLHDDEDHPESLPPAGNDLILPSDFEEVLAKMPKETQDEFRALLMRSLNKTEPESQHSLLDSLFDAFKKVQDSKDLTSLMEELKQPPDQLMASMSQWLTEPRSAPAVAAVNSPPKRPVYAPVAPTVAADTPLVVTDSPADTFAPVSQRDELLDRISGEYSSSTLARARIRKDIENQLKDVPDGVAISALEDWIADLEAVQPGRTPGDAWDPDPTTNSTTSLKLRIERQTAGEVPATGGNERLR